MLRELHVSCSLFQRPRFLALQPRMHIRLGRFVLVVSYHNISHDPPFQCLSSINPFLCSALWLSGTPGFNIQGNRVVVVVIPEHLGGCAVSTAVLLINLGCGESWTDVLCG
jgi:hypothetical protein